MAALEDPGPRLLSAKVWWVFEDAGWVAQDCLDPDLLGWSWGQLCEAFS
jgi:hypothetical protein